MLKLTATTRFQKDLKLCKKRNYDLNLLNQVVDILRIRAILPQKNKDHYLKGNYSDKKECHIMPDWLLIYRIQDDELVLERTGTHSDLFRE